MNRRYEASNFRNTLVYLVLIFFVLGFSCHWQAFAQNSAQRSQQTSQERIPTFATNISGLHQIHPPVDSKRTAMPGTMCPPPQDTLHMEFNLEWTNYQVHRSDDYDPIQVILSGTINSDAGNVWNLNAASHLPGQDPNLYFIEDTFGRPGPAYGSDITLNWEISIDGGAFAPMALGPNNTLTTIFPPGIHNFQVRITGIPQYHESDGYYQLQLEQTLVPQL